MIVIGLITVLFDVVALVLRRCIMVEWNKIPSIEKFSRLAAFGYIFSSDTTTLFYMMYILNIRSRVGDPDLDSHIIKAVGLRGSQQMVNRLTESLRYYNS